MKRNTVREPKNAYMTLAAVAVVMLLSAALVVPSSNAYAVSQNGNGKSDGNGIFSLLFTLFANLTNDNKDLKQDLKEQKNGTKGVKQEIQQDLKTIKDDRKELKDAKEDAKDKKHPDKCKPNKHGKYNKDCTEDQGGN